MRPRGVLILGLIICCTAKCNSEEEFSYDYGIGDIPSDELAEDYLLRADENKCSEDKDCAETQKCVEKDGWKSCQCADGLSGENCDTNEWCKDPEKFQNCKDENGVCEYDKKKRSVVCTCDTGKQWHTAEKLCKNTCSEDKDCTETQKCVEKDGWKSCQCADGLSGENCDTNEWCKDPEKFQNCKDENGVCEYDKKKRSVVCTCDTGKQWHTAEKLCKNTCSEDKDCTETQKCVEKDGWKSCQCADGLSGENCDTNEWCKDPEKFQNCNDENGVCEYDKKKRSVVCTCDTGKQWHPTEKICKDTCSKDEDCTENQICVEKDGWKVCRCAEGLSGNDCKKHDWCEGTGKFKNCKGDNGTCEYSKEKRSVVCTCAVPKRKLHPNENRCRETCTEESECKYGGKCEGKDGGNKFCSCNLGLTGDKCETVFDCSSVGKYKDCKKSGGECKYDGSKAVCECSGKKKLHDKDNVCKDTCSKHEDCMDTQICVEEEGWKVCRCAKGLSGDDCKKKDWCEGTGKFKNCKGENGTCEYSKEKRSVVCTCAVPERKLHPNENRCRETCTQDSECKYGGKCEEKDGGNKFCFCNSGLIGDKCQTVFDCSSTGKYKGCIKSGGECKYDGNITVCECSGNKKLHDKDNVCKECDCGPKGTCKFVNGEKICRCDEDFEVKDGRCRETCHENDCEYDSECKLFGDFSFCVCNKGLSGDKCDIVDDCGTKGKFKNCTPEKGKCEYNTEEKIAVCACPDEKKLNPILNYCQAKCSSNESCKRGSECVNEFCQCLDGTEGDDCDKVTACEFLQCEEKNAVCTYNSSKTPNTFCVCNGANYIFVEKEKRCVEKCKSSDFCQNGGICNIQTNLCECKPNTSGDKCDKIQGCDSLKCKDIKAKCIYDAKNEKATCECLENNHYYEEGKCKPEWCKTGCNNAVSTCTYENGVGICNCKTDKKYYDYGAKTCKDIDPCFNMTCEGNLICENGKCDCPKTHKRNGTMCEPPDLCKNKCFSDAQCEESSTSGYVRCLCNSPSKFYHPKQKKCIDGVCFLPVERKNCSGRCPPGMQRIEGECKHQDDKKTCGQDCGFLGWCEKVNDTEHKCRCDPKYAEEDKKTKKCVLKSSDVCPMNERAGDGKCKCTGKYKQATNGITCDLKSCSDEDVQKECKMKRATKCVDNWKDDKGYKCVCPEGYIDDKDKGCIDPCSQDKAKDDCSANGQKCFIGQKIGNIDCRCPPAFTYDGNKKSCDLGGANAFIISSLPVLSEKYETIENNINKVLLNIDVSTSMMQAFRNLDFAHVLDFKVDKAVLFCDVWLQFQNQLPEKFNASAEVQRWRNQIREINERHILLPGLFLRSDHTAAKEEELTLCIPLVQQSLCGTGSTCENSKCFCETGFREIDSTIKASGNKRIVRCEDIDECKEGKHNCADNSECVNTPGDYFCKCKPGFKKEKGIPNALDKTACIGLCDANPCGKGTCKLTKENTVDCTCPAGYTGSFCNREDVNLAKASKATKVVGAILGTLLAIVIILIIVYVVRQRKNSYSEDFTPAPRVDNAEMVERRPMRGVTNRAYQ
ncbi:unnamed protein product [Larinioides sclopetarius]|uniref:EGF-like domain-containing protein n=1 Tax=Larinioides sclopetarius TaxID=280406 RepID=A0AAV2BJY8_9ARAC